MATLRTLTALTLCALLTLAGYSMALARGQAPAVGSMVLCTGHGTVVVYVDAEGQPTSAPQLCSDGVQALSHVLPVTAPDVTIERTFEWVNPVVAPAATDRAEVISRAARDPPSSSS